jgi:hypothetical protein
MQDKLFRKAALEKLSSPEELDQLMQVTTPKGWVALVALIGFLGAAVMIGIFGVITISVEGAYCVLVNEPATDRTQAFVYVAWSEENVIEASDAVQITPSSARQSDDGFILGRALAVGNFPVDTSAMLEVLGNETLVNQLLQDGPLIQILVELLPTEKTDDNPTGYQWSSGNIPAIDLKGRLPCSATIQVDEKAPIDLVLRRTNA